MNDIIKSAALTMSSREIADLLGSRHADVGRSIRRLIKSKVIGEYTPSPYTNSQNGQQYEEYFIGKRDSYVIVAQMSPEFTAKLVDRWQELESQLPALPDFNNPAEAARAWANEFEQKQIAQKELAIAAPKAEFYDAVTGSDDCIDMAQVAKVLNIKGMGRNKLFSLLRDKSVLQSGASKRNQPYQKHVDAGRFRLIETSWTDDLGDTHVRTKTVVLQKGLDYIRKLVERDK